MSVKVAVVGAGYLGRHHARIYAELEETELVGIVDVDAELASEVASEHGSKPYSHYRDVLGAADALSIVVPTTSHYAVALECLRSGKDVLVEKPMTVTVEEAGALIAEARRADRILQVGHLERYNPGVIALSRVVREPQFIEAVRVSPFVRRGADVDVTLDLMIHDIDVILSLVSAPIKRIESVGFALVTDKIDEAKVWMEFGNGTIALLTASRIAREKDRRLRIYQQGACIELDYQKSEVRRYYSTKPTSPLLTGDGRDINFEICTESLEGCSVETIKPEYAEPLKRELRDFIRCVRTRQRPQVSGVEGRDALKVVLEINTSMRRTDR